VPKKKRKSSRFGIVKQVALMRWHIMHDAQDLKCKVMDGHIMTLKASRRFGSHDRAKRIARTQHHLLSAKPFEPILVDHLHIDAAVVQFERTGT
jgi:hypothetical protein